MEKKISNRKKQAMAMRDHIKETAVSLFEEYGFENVSMEEIAKAAGCSVGNIYNYFKNKDELSLQVTDHVDELYKEIAEEYAKDEDTAAREKLINFVGRSLQISYEEEVLYRSFAHAMTYPEQGILKIKPEREWIRLLNRLIEECKEEGSLPREYPTEEILSALVIIHRGTLMEYRIEQGKFPLKQRGRRLADAYLKGLK